MRRSVPRHAQDLVRIAGVAHGRLSTPSQRRSTTRWIDGRPIGDERLAEGGLEGRVVLDPDATRAERPRRRRRSRSARGRWRPRPRPAAGPGRSGSSRSAGCRTRGSIVRRPLRTAVSTSASVIPSPPSPTSATTADPDGPARRRSPRAGRSPWRRTSSRGTCPGRRKRKPRAAHVPKLPASVVTIAVVGQELAQEGHDLARDGRPGRSTGGRRSPWRPPRPRGPRRCGRTGRRCSAASSTPRVSRRATAARRNSRASDVIVIAAGGELVGDPPGRDVDVRPARARRRDRSSRTS